MTRPQPWLFGVLPLAAALAGAAPAAAAPPLLPPARMQQGGTYHEPPGAVDPIYLPQGPQSGPGDGAEASGQRLELRLNLRAPLRGKDADGVGTQGGRPRSPTLHLDLRYLPQADAGWFAQLSFASYLRSGAQQSWDPDFIYVVGYEAPGPEGPGLSYSNYNGNRLRPQGAERRTDFRQGQWTLGYKFELPPAWEPALLVGDGDAASCRGALHHNARYVSNASGAPERHKGALSLGCRYMRPGGWFAQLTLFAYPRGGQQQPWDPDYSFSFGLQDTQPGSLSLHYENYSGNRYPGRGAGAGSGGLREGAVVLSWLSKW